ncbi:MAG TPA: hypothetical protein VI814_15560 [Candidatus Limnocylindria bacterium]
MSDELPERDPLADLVSRSVGVRVESVVAEELPADDAIERRRLRYRTSDGERTAIFERAPRGVTLAAQLLPFLARKSDRVPLVHARGLPPPHAALGPWVLFEDVLGAPTACDGDPADVVRAKLAIERSVADDEPALRALGVRADGRGLPPVLAALPRVLVHGDLRCATARRVERGVVIAGWSAAFLGCGALDVASLVLDLERAGRSTEAVRAAYAAASGADDPVAVVVAAIALVRSATVK